MSDGNTEGYLAGYKDGLAGRSKKVNREMPKLKSIISAKFVNDYLKGYENGYRSGTYARNRDKNQGRSR